LANQNPAVITNDHSVASERTRVAGVANPFDKNPETGVNKVVFNLQSNKPWSVPGRRPRPDGEQGLGDIRPRRCQGDSCAET